MTSPPSCTSADQEHEDDAKAKERRSSVSAAIRLVKGYCRATDIRSWPIEGTATILWIHDWEAFRDFARQNSETLSYIDKFLLEIREAVLGGDGSEKCKSMQPATLLYELGVNATTTPMQHCLHVYL